MKIRIRKLRERCPFHGKVEEITGFQLEDGKFKNIDLVVDGKTYRIWAPWKKTFTEEEVKRLDIANSKKFGDLEVGDVVQGLYILTSQGYRNIPLSDLNKLEIVQKAREGSAAETGVVETEPSLFISLVRCPSCGEKMVWIKEEIAQALKHLNQAIFQVAKLLHLSVLGKGWL